MGKIKKECLSCAHFRPTDPQKGLCRVDKKSKPDYPQVELTDGCEKWSNCGQQYFIRLGWIRRQLENSGAGGTDE